MQVTEKQYFTDEDEEIDILMRLNEFADGIEKFNHKTLDFIDKQYCKKGRITRRQLIILLKIERKIFNGSYKEQQLNN